MTRLVIAFAIIACLSFVVGTRRHNNDNPRRHHNTRDLLSGYENAQDIMELYNEMGACNSFMHRSGYAHGATLTNHWRSRNYRPTHESLLKCDRFGLLMNTWYRFKILGNDGKLATGSIPRHSCGTRMALGLRPHPTPREYEEVTVDYCGRVRDDSDGCVIQPGSVTERNCSTFFIYKFTALPLDCPFAFCLDPLPPRGQPGACNWDNITTVNQRWRTRNNRRNAELHCDINSLGLNTWYRFTVHGANVALAVGSIPVSDEEMQGDGRWRQRDRQTDIELNWAATTTKCKTFMFNAKQLRDQDGARSGLPPSSRAVRGGDGQILWEGGRG